MTDIVRYFKTNEASAVMLSELSKRVRLLLCIPVTTCSAERSFSLLRILKTYLRSTMSQQRLTHLALLNCYKDLTSTLDLKILCNELITANETRQKTFALNLELFAVYRPTFFPFSATVS